jgi:adenylosuccinate synthase
VIDRHAFIVVDLGFGDSGKGTIVDTLVQRTGADLVVRFNGGAQAGHNVVTTDGRHHTFSQFGSGTFTPGCRTFLSRMMVVHPLAALVEEKHLQRVGVTDAFDRLTVDQDAFINTPYHQAINRLRELSRGDARHGSCGVGFGATVHDAYFGIGPSLRVRDLATAPTDTIRMYLKQIRAMKLDEVVGLPLLHCKDEAARELHILSDDKVLERIIDGFYEFICRVRVGNMPIAKTTIFEGAQGVLLDETFGFHPYTTWSKCTGHNARMLWRETYGWGQEIPAKTIGVVRAYATRHGPGPFPTEDTHLGNMFPDIHNTHGAWQGEFRVGYFDAVLTRYAIAADGHIDGLAVTHLDYEQDWKIGVGYHVGEEYLTDLLVDDVWGVLPEVCVQRLEEQQRLGEKLFEAVPVYAASSANPNVHTQWIEYLTHKPVLIKSFGPRAIDKEFSHGFTP